MARKYTKVHKNKTALNSHIANLKKRASKQKTKLNHTVRTEGTTHWLTYSFSDKK